MQSTLDEQLQETQQRHRRESVRLIFLPFVGGVVLILLGLVIAMLLPNRSQASIISDFTLSILVLCPAILCLFPIALGLIVLAFGGMNWVHEKASSPLAKLEKLSYTLLDKTVQVTDKVSRSAIGLNSAVAPVDRLLFSKFDSKHEDTHDQSTSGK